ncbi:isopentenyl-diphosphate Delta-isomerase [Gandjariella thermophila]|uniref:Isopentenyl-diphosphate Delta-isomerase n=1 Tax=Gandjariella thermophila TaxID=1931992 RepID=A0A4D4IX43_9PSEU|nr:isopentenyl-diphosphate Delta-isomerase [Gandjariella thermophila]GDY28925.1 isopentenyl-diphosphate Delta-isomerase [Gandjariella thermophila]
MSHTDERLAHAPSPAVNATAARAPELVVLLDDDYRPVGTADKLGVHHEDTPLHLAFSCYVFDDAGRLLVTRRSLAKRTWPGVWTNSCCGHPAPDEDPTDAVHRRVRQELGIELTDLGVVLPDFAYRAVAADGTVENEFCPVHVARTDQQPQPDPDEVMEWHWVEWDRFVTLATVAPWAVSPWAAMQVPLLAEKL